MEIKAVKVVDSWANEIVLKEELGDEMIMLEQDFPKGIVCWVDYRGAEKNEEVNFYVNSRFNEMSPVYGDAIFTGWDEEESEIVSLTDDQIEYVFHEIKPLGDSIFYDLSK